MLRENMLAFTQAVSQHPTPKPALSTIPPPETVTSARYGPQCHSFWQQKSQPGQRPTHDCPPRESGPHLQKASRRIGRPQGWV